MPTQKFVDDVDDVLTQWTPHSELRLMACAINMQGGGGVWDTGRGQGIPG